MTIYQCMACANMNSDGNCKAFRDGIPFELLNNKVIHNKPYPGDNGIQFEPNGMAALSGYEDINEVEPFTDDDKR